MKQCAALLLAACLTVLPSCRLLRTFMPHKPERVTVEGVSYRRGFYGDLYPQNIVREADGPCYEIDGYKFYPVSGSPYAWLICTNGDSTAQRAEDGTLHEGTLYCAEGQWEEARAYYGDPAHFSCFCRVGGNFTDAEPEVVPLPALEPAQFDALMAFAQAHCYEPFQTARNEGIDTRRVPYPDQDGAPRLIVYRESADGFFTSTRRFHFYILDGSLLLIYQYALSSGEMDVVPVPDAVAGPVLALLNPAVTAGSAQR